MEQHNAVTGSIVIADRRIGPGHRPYVIAEMSGNHNQSLERALAIVDAAAASGADAIKLQTYTAATMTLDTDAPGFVIEDAGSLWAGRQLYDLYDEAHTPWEWHGPIMERARSHGMACFSTPFDESAVDFLESLGAPAYKIASFECTDLPLIRKVAATGKPMIVSTGMATLAEIDETVRTAIESGCRDLVLLKCTSTYPSSPENTNLRSIPALRDAFAQYGVQVGLSDHTMGCGAAVAAVALGATVVEKHFTLARADGGVDSAFSLEPAELAMLRVETERAWQAMGSVRFGASAPEKKSMIFRRSLYITQPLQPGDRLGPHNVRTIRPGYGLPPKYLETVMGKRINRTVPAGTPLAWALLD
ncbi:MAG: pseudaminic acid synthase [Burkholderiaceae bacterium]|nr:pseudaminic acid synthase [Burkholderiaceae bacterium]